MKLTHVPLNCCNSILKFQTLKLSLNLTAHILILVSNSFYLLIQAYPKFYLHLKRQTYTKQGILTSLYKNPFGMEN